MMCLSALGSHARGCARQRRVALHVHEELWSQAEARLEDDELGLRFAQEFDLDGFHVVGLLALTSATVGQALERVVAFSRLLHDAGRTELELTEDGRLLLFPGCRGLPAPPPRQIAEYNMASAVMLMRMLIGHQAWRPLEVHFTHEAPQSLTRHRAVFGLEPSFGMIEDKIILPLECQALPVLAAQPASMSRYLEAYAQELLSRLPQHEDTLSAQVMRLIVTQLEMGQLTLEAVAARLAMTPRTLQRRLEQEGERFSSLVDSARQRAAQHHLSRSTLSLAEISYLVGFQEPSTFYKAFKRWTGQTPSHYRQLHAQP